jgi:hypothetical protein
MPQARTITGTPSRYGWTSAAAHQESVTLSFSWPPGITEKLVVALTHLHTRWP